MTTIHKRKSNNGDKNEAEKNEIGEEDDAYLVDPRIGHNWKLVSYEMLPNWLKDNHYIHDGYRPPLGSMNGN